VLTKSDFQQIIRDSIANYPAIGPLYQAGDPRILQHLDAMAAMLGMLSAQIDAAQAEPFEKVRDSTVLADAATRGIVLKAPRRACSTSKPTTDSRCTSASVTTAWWACSRLTARPSH
jgi:hypothetical protein